MQQGFFCQRFAFYPFVIVVYRQYYTCIYDSGDRSPVSLSLVRHNPTLHSELLQQIRADTRRDPQYDQCETSPTYSTSEHPFNPYPVPASFKPRLNTCASKSTLPSNNCQCQPRSLPTSQLKPLKILLLKIQTYHNSRTISLIYLYIHPDLFAYRDINVLFWHPFYKEPAASSIVNLPPWQAAARLPNLIPYSNPPPLRLGCTPGNHTSKASHLLHLLSLLLEFLARTQPIGILRVIHVTQFSFEPALKGRRYPHLHCIHCLQQIHVGLIYSLQTLQYR